MSLICKTTNARVKLTSSQKIANQDSSRNRLEKEDLEMVSWKLTNINLLMYHYLNVLLIYIVALTYVFLFTYFLIVNLKFSMPAHYKYFSTFLSREFMW